MFNHLRSIKTFRLIPVAAMLFTAVSTHSLLAQEPELSPFKIVYAVKYSIGKGRMTLAMTHDASGTYALDSEIVAEGLAKMIMSNPASQDATFVINDGVVQGMGYSVSDGSEENTRGGRIEYDWDSSEARLFSMEDGDSVQPLAPGTMDDVVMQAAAALEAKRGNKEFSFLELEPGKDLREHTFKYIGEEPLKSEIGEINTVKYSQNRAGSSRTTYIWFSLDHDYVPVELMRERKGKTIFTAKLVSLEQ